MKNNNKVTMKDLAEESGVSATTVSLVLNGDYVKRKISEDLAVKVRLAARKLGYTIDLNARGMRSGKQHYVIALMTSYEAPASMVDILAKDVDQYLNSIKDNLITFSLVIKYFHAGNLNRILSDPGQTNFHAAIIANTLPNDDKYLKDNIPLFPIVLIGRQIKGYSALLSEPCCGGDLAAKILLESGCRKVAILQPEKLTQTTRARIRSFRNYVKKNKADNPVQVIGECLDEKSGYEALKKFLDKNKPIDGLFTISDIMAVGAYRAIKEKNLRIPQDIKVCGFDNMSFAPYMEPALTSIYVKRNKYLSEAARLIISMLKKELKEPMQISIPSELIIRESTCSFNSPMK